MKIDIALFKKLLGLCVLAFFGFGAFYGGELFRNFKYMKEPQALNLLLYSHMISPEAIQDIAKDLNLKISIDYAESLFEIEDKLKDPKAKYDLISIYSFQAIELNEEARLQALNWSMIKNLKNISSDFLSLGGDEISKKLLPLSWGVNGFAYDSTKFTSAVDSWGSVLVKLGPKDRIMLFDIPLSLYHFGQLLKQHKLKQSLKSNSGEQNMKAMLDGILAFSKLYHLWSREFPNPQEVSIIEMPQSKENFLKDYPHFKFVIPKEGGLFWTLNLAQPRFAPHPREASLFLGAVLEKKYALEILNYGKASSTSLTLNADPIDQRLKAQYIREIPLINLRFQKNIEDSALFTQLIDEAQKHSGH